jgi:putative transposase
LIDPSAQLSVRRQCELLRVSRSGLAYEAVLTSQEELALMRQIDELHLRYPFYGSRKIAQTLSKAGEEVNRKRVQRLMRVMGLEAIAPKPSTSKAQPEHVKYPYLLRGLKIGRVNHVWAADITYIPMAAGFVYLVAVLEWYSRLVLSWRLSNTMDPSFCVDALEAALLRYGAPEIFNTDQGSQFTAEAFTGALRDRGIAISMDGKGRCIDNIFVERLWRSLKYEEVYLHAYDGMNEGSPRRNHAVHDVLQRRAPSSGSRVSDPRCVPSQPSRPPSRISIEARIVVDNIEELL